MNLMTAVRGRIVCAVAVLAFGVGGFALPNVHDVAQQVDAHYNGLRSLQAEFTEIYQGNGTERQESGTLWLKKPGKMRWEYRSPEEKVFLSDGKAAWLYLPAERQARKSSLKSLEDLRSPLAFLLGKTKLEKELQGLSFATDVKAWKEEDSMIRGVPRGMADRVEQVLLEITPEHRIVRILIHSTDDSITEYRFNDQKENVEVPDKEFRFVAPAGAEVIEEQPSAFSRQPSGGAGVRQAVVAMAGRSRFLCAASLRNDIACERRAMSGEPNGSPLLAARCSTLTAPGSMLAAVCYRRCTSLLSSCKIGILGC